MIISNEMRLSKLKNSPEEVFELYSSMETTHTIKDVVAKYHIQNRDGFVDIVGDTILGFIPRSNLEVELMKSLAIEVRVAGAIANDLQVVFGKPVKNPALPDADSTIKEGIELRPEQGQPTPIAASTGSSAPKPLTREELLSALSAKRTMAGDIEAVRRTQSNPTQTPPPPPPTHTP